jgi:hypothetical protein
MSLIQGNAAINRAKNHSRSQPSYRLRRNVGMSMLSLSYDV